MSSHLPPSQQQQSNSRLRNPIQYTMHQPKLSHVPHPVSLSHQAGPDGNVAHQDLFEGDSFTQPTFYPATGPLDDLEDVDYQTGMASYRQQQQQRSSIPYQSPPSQYSVGVEHDPWFGSPPGFGMNHPASLAMSAPANISMGTSPPSFFMPPQVSSSSGPQSFEDDYNVQIK